jgi:hypothetical protein
MLALRGQGRAAHGSGTSRGAKSGWPIAQPWPHAHAASRVCRRRQQRAERHTPTRPRRTAAWLSGWFALSRTSVAKVGLAVELCVDSAEAPGASVALPAA